MSDPIRKRTKAKEAGVMVQVVECLPGKHKAPVQTPVPQKNFKRGGN
jgi:hypothetical protein